MSVYCAKGVNFCLSRVEKLCFAEQIALLLRLLHKDFHDPNLTP